LGVGDGAGGLEEEMGKWGRVKEERGRGGEGGKRRGWGGLMHGVEWRRGRERRVGERKKEGKRERKIERKGGRLAHGVWVIWMGGGGSGTNVFGGDLLRACEAFREFLV